MNHCFFSVSLLAQGQFSGPTYFDLPEIDGAIMMQVSERPIFESQQIGDDSYVSARYDFTVYAQRAGNMQVPPITARFGSKKSFDQALIEYRLQTEPFNLTVTAPPGANSGEIIVSARELTATETWLPKPVSAKVGDAFTRTITVRAQKVPAMLLPPPRFEDVAGIAIYPKPPQVSDENERGDFIGERVDSATYICERAGSFEIPEMSIRWWDPSNDQWQTKRFPAVEFKVAENPFLNGQSASTIHAFDLSSWVESIIILLTLIVVALFAVKPVKRYWQTWRKSREASEAVQWKRLRKSCARGEAAEIYREMNRWLSHFKMSSAEITIGILSDKEINDGARKRLRTNCIALQQQLAGLDSQWDKQVFIDEMIALRRRLKTSSNINATQDLPMLNP